MGSFVKDEIYYQRVRKISFFYLHFSTQAQLALLLNYFLDMMTKLIGRDTKFLCLFT